MKSLIKKSFLLIISMLICVTLFGTACSLDGCSSNNTSGNGGNEQAPLVEKTIRLDELQCDYNSVGHGKFTVNADNNGEPLSLYNDGNEAVHEHGYFAHAYSVIVFEGLETMGFTKFSAYIGIHKTARVSNSQTSVVFKVYLDNKEAYVSEEFDEYTNQQLVELDVKGVDRITLVADSLNGNGNDHAVWADCQLTYYNDIKPDLQAYDVEFASPYNVTGENILENARATSFDGRNLSGAIEYTTDYVAGETGKFNVTYKVSDGVATAEKTVTMTVLSDERYSLNASEAYLTTPFADYVYYGRSLLSGESRKAYDLLMEKLLKTDIGDTSVTSVTVDLQANGIYIFPSEVSKIKTYLIYDEARLFFLYDWHYGQAAGVSHTKKNGLVGTVTVSLNNGANGYYKGISNIQAYLTAEKGISEFFSPLSSDMTDAQLLYSVQNSYRPTLTYANVNYADGFYGAFITKNCICSGYSMGYQHLAQRLGVRAAYVVGTAGGAHAWNDLFVEGEWYMSDTTWGNGDSFGLLGKSYMDSAGRFDHGNYGKMPSLAQDRYDLDLMRYNLMSIKSGYIVKCGESLDLKNLVNVVGAVADKAPVSSVTYDGTLNTAQGGIYNLKVRAVNTLGNVASGDCEVFVYTDSDALSGFTPMQTGKSNYSFKSVSLYYGGAEQAFTDGLYTKANGTLTLSFNVAGNSYRYFCGYVGVEKTIRDNVDWGWQVNATVKVYADGQLLYSKSGIGWKADMSYIAVRLPDDVRTLKLEITDNSGQGGIGWGNCRLYF